MLPKPIPGDTVGAWTRLLLDGLLPRHCLICGFESGKENICTFCSLQLPRISHSCVQCSLPLLHPDDRYCGHCLHRPPPWDDAAAALAYEFPVDQLVCRFKFGHNLACGQVLARELTLAVRQRYRIPPSCILPVPLHRFRHFSRTFNQAELLARRVGKAVQAPVYGSILLRRRWTRAHSGLGASSRRKNIRNAFVCRIPAGAETRFQHVALVDDVMTTGATLAECTRTLKKSGIDRVSVWVPARTLEPHQVWA